MVQAIGSEVAAETSNMAERKAPAKIVAVSRMVVLVNIINPLVIVLEDPTAGSMPLSMQGSCHSEKIILFQ